MSIMNSTCYRFGDVTFRLNTPAPMEEEDSFAPFMAERCGDPDFILEASFGDPGAGITCQRQGRRLAVTLDPLRTKRMSPGSLMQAVKAPLLFPEKSAFLLHAAYIVHEGKAILFTAPSGTGKSTQAEFWRTWNGAEIINGDRALISRRDGVFHAHGIYASGTSGICKNVSAPIGAVILLEQGARNEIRQIRGRELFSRILEQCSYDTGSDAHRRILSGMIAELIGAVPTVCYACRHHPDAVGELEKQLWNNA